MPFVPAIELCRVFHAEAVRPVLLRRFGELPYAAALIGYGSDVLGYDDARSTDHQWGPRLLLFLSPDDHRRHAPAIGEALAAELPFEVLGYSTHYGPADDEGIARSAPARGRPVNHLVQVLTLSDFFTLQLGFDPTVDVTQRDWLLTSGQKLLEVTAGAIYHDDTGALTEARLRLQWYPDDVWLYILACQWQRIGQEEAFVGRCAAAGDDLGSRLVAGRLVRDLMQLCFLLERRYALYSKWLGTAFARLDCAGALLPSLTATLAATNIQDREEAMSWAYETIAALHNATGLTESLDSHVRNYFGRPFRVIGAPRFVKATRNAIPPGPLRQLTSLTGSVDQFADSTDVLSNPRHARALGAIYDV